jgi:hypothetical protein
MSEERTAKQPLIQEANLNDNQMMKVLATMVAKLQRAAGGPLVVSLKEVENTEVTLDIKILGGQNLVITAIDPRAPQLVRADATVLDRLRNGTSLQAIS